MPERARAHAICSVVHMSGRCSGDRRGPPMSTPCVPRREGSGWIIDRFAAVQLTWRGDLDDPCPLSKFLGGHRPGAVGLINLTLIESPPLFVRGCLEVVHLHERAPI
jgi:hypothetical protein